ncbi:2,3-butanediol dehydrogenase [Pseudoclavibacter sp. CFCC 13611]|uniref:2,3-butanediol dehydrogenase n=1 Tax=Pseudoclavibacter sp. CFCC 13611 TaxID=2615178 RepID=UPI0013011792|nr:2,3-butanediol dehydrogenase [Pseudoclavibacter sp. CFCC 13611]KAB1662943.1 2,3-butanediol dehydrogenase [Pseudoclavibacter sp. CFCC 13611]
MKAARYYDRGDIRIEDIEPQQLKPGTVRIDVAWCGICGTDLHEFLDGPIFVPPAGHPHPISGESAPVTLGHEFSGVISEVGEGIDDLKVGDHVVVEPYIISDDVYTGPESKDYHLSKDMNFIGLAGRGGGLAENVVVRRRWVHKIDAGLPLDQAALIEPLSVAYHAVERSGVQEGQTAIVGGAGPIGQLTAAVLHALGVKVIISELSPLRRQKALDAGVADYAFNPAEVDVVEETRKLTDGKGADVAFECTSVQVVLDTLLDAVRPTGVIVIVSIWGKKAELDMHKIVMKELDIRGTIGYVNSHPATIKLVESGKIDLKPFITGKIALDHLVDEGFDTLIHRNERAVKILVSPSGKGLDQK